MISNLPPRNPVFTGRDDLLTRLHHQLTASGARGSVAVVGQTLYGLGGVGKTQLALEYAHRYAADYDLIWWIAAENPLNIPAALIRLAPRLNIPPTDDQEAVAAAVLDALRARERWLLVSTTPSRPMISSPTSRPEAAGTSLSPPAIPAGGLLGRRCR